VGKGSPQCNLGLADLANPQQCSGLGDTPKSFDSRRASDPPAVELYRLHAAKRKTTSAPTHRYAEEIAAAYGASVIAVERARMDPKGSLYRNAPRDGKLRWHD
jgi:hypothetical protein